MKIDNLHLNNDRGIVAIGSDNVNNLTNNNEFNIIDKAFPFGDNDNGKFSETEIQKIKDLLSGFALSENFKLTGQERVMYPINWKKSKLPLNNKIS